MTLSLTGSSKGYWSARWEPDNALWRVFNSAGVQIKGRTGYADKDEAEDHAKTAAVQRNEEWYPAEVVLSLEQREMQNPGVPRERLFHPAYSQRREAIPTPTQHSSIPEGGEIDG